MAIKGKKKNPGKLLRKPATAAQRLFRSAIRSAGAETRPATGRVSARVASPGKTCKAAANGAPVAPWLLLLTVDSDVACDWALTGTRLLCSVHAESPGSCSSFFPTATCCPRSRFSCALSRPAVTAPVLSSPGRYYSDILHYYLLCIERLLVSFPRRPSDPISPSRPSSDNPDPPERGGGPFSSLASSVHRPVWVAVSRHGHSSLARCTACRRSSRSSLPQQRHHRPLVSLCAFSAVSSHWCSSPTKIALRPCFGRALPVLAACTAATKSTPLGYLRGFCLPHLLGPLALLAALLPCCSCCPAALLPCCPVAPSPSPSLSLSANAKRK